MPYELTKELSEEEWVNRRSNYLGGSEVAAALGESKYKTPYQLWLEKTGRMKTNVDNQVTYFGQIFEPHLAENFEMQTSLSVQQDLKTRYDPDYPFLSANIDRLIVSNDEHSGPGVLELKTTTSHAVRNWDEEFPREWLYQIQHYLMITGFEYAYLQIYERNSCIYHDPVFIERDEYLIQRNRQKLIEFWHNHILEDQPPDFQNSEDLKIAYPQEDQDKVIEASDEIFNRWLTLKQVRQRKKELQELETSLKNELKEEMGDAEELNYDGEQLCTWKSSSRRRFSVSSFREDHPDLYDHYAKEKQTRRFLIKQ